MTVEISILIAIVSCFIGLAGWLSGRDKRITGDAEWKGNVNAKLDNILGIRSDVEAINVKIREHDKDIVATKTSVEYAHSRIDELENRRNHSDT